MVLIPGYLFSEQELNLNNNFLLYIKMTEKKHWAKEQDEALIYLRDQECVTKWSQIARKMKAKFGKNSRNQKQCRDRYINHLSVKKDDLQWGKQEQQKMIELHQQLGNKWAAISQKFNGITQNFIKNQFYSRLRKSIRKINNSINQTLGRQFKQFKLNLIFKLASIVDGKLKKNNDIRLELNTAYTDFLYVLISYPSDGVSDLLVGKDIEQSFLRKLVAPLLSLEQIFHYINKKNNKKTEAVKPSSLRFGAQRLSLTNESAQFHNQLSKRILSVSQKATNQLKEFMRFYNENILSKLHLSNQHKSQEQVQKIKQELTLKQMTHLNKNAVSQTEIQISLQKRAIKQYNQNNNNLQISTIYRIWDGNSDIIQEQSEIINFLYQQSPRSISFIVQNWNNSQQSEISAKWED